MATTQTLTLGTAATAFSFAGQPSDADTITIGDKVYQFKNTTAAAYDVKIGASLDATLANIAAAVNASGTGDGTDYHAGTAQNPYFSASADTTDDDIDLTARFAGAWVNGIALAKSGANITAGGANFAAISGGTDGAGRIDTHIDDIIDLCQVNAEVLTELRKITAAAD